jgi:hypothetical protein
VTLSLLIPVAVARAVTSSTTWKEAGFQRFTPVVGRFDLAASSSGRDKLYIDTEQQLATVEELVEQARQEQTRKPTTKAIEAFQEDLQKLGKRLARLKEFDERRAQETKTSLRKVKRERRERPLALEVDVEQIEVLKEIAEDYGLNLDDPQVRAGLTAAFRAGALAFAGGVDALRVSGATSPYSDDQIAKWDERNRVLFERVTDPA